MVPVSMLFPRDIYVHARKLPKADGMVPTKLFVLKSRIDKLVRPPKEDGMDPVSPMLDSCIAVTRLLVHVTPVQTVPVHIAVVGELDVHDHIV